MQTETRQEPKGSPEKFLGWGIQAIPREEIAKTLKKNPNYWIAEKRNREKQYLLSSIPILSVGEAQLVQEVLEKFQLHASRKSETKPLEWFLHEFTEENQLELEPEQAKYLLTVLEKMAFGLGPLGELLKNDELEEIAISGTGKEKPVRVFHKTFGWLCTNLFFSDTRSIKNLVNKMARKLGRRLSMQTPRLNAVLEDGSRIHAVMEPIAFSGISATIRKFRFNPFTPPDLLQTGTVNAEILAFLWMALQSDSTILFCGNTGSGKTTTLNALFCFVPENERIVVAEETPEIRLPHQHQIKLVTNPELGISMHSLILDSLRMRPDRIIVGEMRTSEESKAFVDTLLAGQGKGSYATFHGQSTSEALFRLQNMGIPETDLASIDLLVIQKRWTRLQADGHRTEERRITEVSELELEQNRLNIRALFEFDALSNQWKKPNPSRKVKVKILRSFGLGEQELEQEIENRKQWLEALKKKEIPLPEFFAQVNGKVSKP